MSSTSGFISSLKNLKAVGLISAVIISLVFLFQNCGGWDSEFSMIRAPILLGAPIVNITSPPRNGMAVADTFDLQVQCDDTGTYENAGPGNVFVWGDFTIAGQNTYTDSNNVTGYLLPCTGGQTQVYDAVVATGIRDGEPVSIDVDQQYNLDSPLANPPPRVVMYDGTGPNLTISQPRRNGTSHPQSPIIVKSLDSRFAISGICEYSDSNAASNVVTVQVLKGTSVVQTLSPSCTIGKRYSTQAFVDPSKYNEGDAFEIKAKQKDVFDRETVVRATGLEVEQVAIDKISITSPTGGWFQNTVDVRGACNATVPGSISEVTLTYTGGNQTRTRDVVCSGNDSYATGDIPILTGLPDGPITIVATQKKNNQPIVSSRPVTINKDTTVDGLLSITKPTMDQNFGSSAIPVEGKCIPGSKATKVFLTGNIQNKPVKVTCSANGTYSTVVVLDAETTKNYWIIANQSDLAGNKEPTAQVRVRLNKSAPIVKIDKPSPATNLPSTVRVEGQCESGAQNTTVAVQVTPPSPNGGSSRTVSCVNNRFAVNVNLPDGNSTVVATQKRKYEPSLIGKDTKPLQTDTAGPSVTITGPLGTVTNPSQRITGTCETGGSAVEIWGDFTPSPTTATCTNGRFTSPVVTVRLGPTGAVVVRAKQSDKNGNPSAVATHQFGFDNIAPNITLVANQASGGTGNPVTLTGRCEAGLNIIFTATPAFALPNMMCPSNGQYSVPAKTFPNGRTTVVAKQTDRAGNTKTTPAATININNLKADKWFRVAMGHDHACGITTSLRTYCWGSNEFGQLGIGNNVNKKINEVVKTSGGAKFTQISVDQKHSCAIRDNELEVYCWGDNQYGRVGAGGGTGAVQYKVPTKVQGFTQAGLPAGTKLKTIEVGYHSSCVLSERGNVYCWGIISSGNFKDKAYLVRRADNNQPLANVISIGVGENHACALTQSQTNSHHRLVYCWGEEQRFSFTRDAATKTVGVRKNYPKAVYAPGFAGDNKEVHVGFLMTCTKKDSGSFHCAGSNLAAQLGVGLASNNNAYGVQHVGRGVNAQAIFKTAGTPGVNQKTAVIGSQGGGSSGCYIEGNSSNYGKVRCWGNNVSGQVTGLNRLPKTHITRPSPDYLKDRDGNFIYAHELSVSGHGVCAVNTQHKYVTCWGKNEFYQNGYNGSVHDYKPTRLANPPSYF